MTYHCAQSVNPENHFRSNKRTFKSSKTNIFENLERKFLKDFGPQIKNGETLTSALSKQLSSPIPTVPFSESLEAVQVWHCIRLLRLLVLQLSLSQLDLQSDHVLVPSVPD